MGTLKIKFPHSEEYEFEAGKPVVLLGANGAGKTRFSIKIEELNDLTFNNWNAQESVLIQFLPKNHYLSKKVFQF